MNIQTQEIIDALCKPSVARSEATFTAKTPEQSLASGVSAFVKSKREQDAVDLLIERMDDWFLAGQFERVDRLLSLLVPAELTPSVLMAVLSAVHPGREKLENRKAFFVAARAELERQLNDKARVSKLVAAFEG